MIVKSEVSAWVVVVFGCMLLTSVLYSFQGNIFQHIFKVEVEEDYPAVLADPPTTEKVASSCPRRSTRVGSTALSVCNRN